MQVSKTSMIFVYRSSKVKHLEGLLIWQALLRNLLRVYVLDARLHSRQLYSYHKTLDHMVGWLAVLQAGSEAYSRRCEASLMALPSHSLDSKGSKGSKITCVSCHGRLG